MAATNACPTCGSLIHPGAPAGQCPACLMDLADEPPATEDPFARSPIKERRFGDYVLGKQLGSGGMGIVYEAHQTSLNRKVALKFIRDSQVASPTLLRRFTIEAEATARLNHPGIVGIHEIGEVEGQPYFSMDLVEGDSLRSAMSQGRFLLNVESSSKGDGRSLQVEIARLMARTARAVHHAHQRGVLHRDLKPANILLDLHDAPRLTDFGLAKILRQATDQDTKQSLTGSGDVAGTPSYMSPEQASSADTTSASDIYGLGAVLYELLTAQPPFKAATPLETLQQVQTHHPRRPRLVNGLVHRDLETICLKCLEKDPGCRYATAEALAEDLESWMEDKPIKARPPGIAARVQQWTKRNPAGTALIATLFAALALTLLLLGVNKAQTRKVQVQQAILFQEKVRQLDEFWTDTNRSSLVINANDLAILANREPSDDPSAKHLTFGTSISSDPISLAQQTYAPRFGRIQIEMARELHHPVELDLKVFKRSHTETEPILTNEVDFMIMEATSYLLARHRNPGLTVIARIDRKPTGVFITRTNTAIHAVSGLMGRTLLFAESSGPMTVWAKAHLVDADIVRKDLASVSNLFSATASAPQPNALRSDFRFGYRATAAAVLRRQVDVAVTLLQRYELDRFNGLELLASFQSTPRVFVARAGLDPKVIAAFRSALPSDPHSTERGKPIGEFVDWEDEFPGALPVDDSDFDDLREAMRKAARFDGDVDPFSPNPGTPAEVR